jgi:D-alanyl-D-alanine carboxypeptidase (penicillin-binding protein 5/6)
VVVDGDTGALVDGHDVHLRLRPASTVKVLTALVAVAALQPDDPVPVSATAARMPPESAGMRAGETWRADDVLHLLLMASDNDAAVALAERVSGGRAGFARDMQATARQLGLVDDPVLDDPSGLDDSAAFGRGDWISAYDLAIVARAALAVPTIRDVVGRRTPYRLKRPDGRVEDVRPQNKLLADPGVIGVKPGYTAQADETLIAAAVHDGRTVITVELGARPAAMYAVAKQLLAKGFAAPVGSQGPLPRLPAVVVPQRVVGNASAWPKSRQPASSGDGSGPVAAVVAGVVIVALTWHLGSRRRGRRSLGRGPTGDRTP